MWIKYLSYPASRDYHKAMDGADTDSKFRPLLLLAVAVVAVGAVIYWFGKTASDNQLSNTGPNQEYMPSGISFQLSYSPSSAAVKAGSTAEVTITVKPAGDFSEALTFRVEDVLKGATSVKNQNILSGKFAPVSLAPADFSKGTALSLSAAEGVVKGLYVISFSVEARGDKKSYAFPVSVE